MPNKPFRRYENGVLALLSITFGLVFYDRVAITFLFPYVAKELQLSDMQLGMISSALALAWAASGYLVGAFSDRTGNRKTILVMAVVGFSVCTALSGAAVSFAVLLLVRVIMGVFEGPVLPISQSIMAQESSPERRGFNMGVLQNAAGAFLSLIVGPPVTAALAEAFGWRTALYIVAVPGLLMALLLWVYLKSKSVVPARAGAGPVSRPVQPVPLRELLRFRNVWLGVLIACCLVTWMLPQLTFAPIYLMRTRGMSGAEMGLVMSLIGVGSIVLGFVVPWCSDRWGRKPAVVVFSAISALSPLALAYLHAPAVQLGMAIMATFFAAGCFPLVMATIPSETVPANALATSLGLIMGVSEIIGGVLAPTLAGMGADRYGPDFPMLVSSVAAVLAAVLALFLVETAPSKVRKTSALPVWAGGS